VFKHFFQYCSLSFILSYDDEKIKEREQYWKKCLNTIQNGYNAN
jgi:hypothetical protein